MTWAPVGGALTRRAFLQASAATAALAFLGCSGGGKGTDGPAGGLAGFPFDMWEGLRTAARSSPDHVRGAANRAVASKDPEAIFAFVRDQISLYPPPPGAYDPATAIRWGTDATLRGGAGTLREKADVLRELYDRAGFVATVVVGPVPEDLASATALDVFTERVRVTDPQVDEGDLARWRERAGWAAEPTSVRPFDDGGATSARIAADLTELLPGRAAEASRAEWPVALAPMVRVMVDGVARFALPVPGAALTDRLAHPASDAPAAGPAPLVRVALSMTSTQAPSDEIELVGHEWSSDDIVGRQVVAQLVPPLSLRERLTLRAQDVHLLVGTLSLRRPGDDQRTLERNIITGQAITVSGLVVEETDDGVAVGGIAVEPATENRDAGAEVASVTVEVDALGFPAVGLRVSALGRAGDPVAAIPASAFVVTEDATPVAAFATRNQAPPPRVLLIVDSSLSIDPTYASPSGRAAFAKALAPQLADAVPHAEVQVIGTGSEQPRPDGWVPLDTTALTTALARAVPVGSAVWTAVAGAEAGHPAVIVLVTDGVSDETDRTDLPRLRAAVARGAPVVVVGIGDVDEPTLDDIAVLSRGAHVTTTAPGDVTPIVDAVRAKLAAAVLDPYRLTYDAPLEGSGPRTVVVAVGGVTGQTTYSPPPPAERTTAPGLRGLYLTVTVGTDPPVKRVLAGLRPLPAGATGPTMTPEETGAVRRALFDTVVVSVEGAAPSLMTWLDDDLTGRLSGRALWEAADQDDGDAMHDALVAGVTALPWELAGLHAPLLPEDGEPLTYERLLRVAVLVDRSGSRRGDILPVTRFDTLGSDRTAAYDRTLRQSARLAVGEQTVFEDSAADRLDDVDLVMLADGRWSPAALAALPAAGRDVWPDLLDDYAGWDKVVPTAGDPIAFWAVDQQTGTLLGVLDDGSGGGRSARWAAPCDDQLSDQAFNALGALGGGVYAAVGKACARIYARAGRTLQAGPVPDKGDPNEILKDLAWDIAKDAAFGKLGGVNARTRIAKESAFDPADSMAEMVGLDIPCPWCAGGAPKPVC